MDGKEGAGPFGETGAKSAFGESGVGALNLLTEGMRNKGIVTGTGVPVSVILRGGGAKLTGGTKLPAGALPGATSSVALGNAFLGLVILLSIGN